VKNKADNLRLNPLYKGKQEEIEDKLKEIMYLPVDYESDVIEEDDN